ncbi:hypothetical protein Vafri_21948, partial [Volvox africanus]
EQVVVGEAARLGHIAAVRVGEQVVHLPLGQGLSAEELLEGEEGETTTRMAVRTTCPTRIGTSDGYRIRIPPSNGGLFSTTNALPNLHHSFVSLSLRFHFADFPTPPALTSRVPNA